MRIVIILLLLISIQSCRKARGLETNKEKKAMIELLIGKWEVLEYHYYYHKGTYYNETNTWEHEYKTEDFINDSLTLNIGTYYTEFKMEFTNINRMEINNHVMRISYDSINSMNYYNINENYITGWKETKDNDYKINAPLLCNMKFLGENLYLDYEKSDEWWGNGATVKCHYILRKL